MRLWCWVNMALVEQWLGEIGRAREKNSKDKEEKRGVGIVCFGWWSLPCAQLLFYGSVVWIVRAEVCLCAP